jgi:hypothetical protein
MLMKALNIHVLIPVKKINTGMLQMNYITYTTYFTHRLHFIHQFLDLKYRSTITEDISELSRKLIWFLNISELFNK